MKRFVNQISIILLFVHVGGCENDILENYRKDYAGTFNFTTIREDVTVVPFEVIDTIYFSGSIDVIYSNRDDIITINFIPGNILDAVVNTSGSLSLPPIPSGSIVETINGSFSDGNTRVEFHYRISSGSSYSVNHKVEGIRY